jgi:hypothetical protein
VNGRNDFLVAAATFFGTMIVVCGAWVIYGTTQNAPPPLQTVANVSDPSEAVRSKPGPNASRGVDLAAARSRIHELERAIADRDERHAGERKKSRALAKLQQEERQKLLEDLKLLQAIVESATVASPRKPEPVPTEDVAPKNDDPSPLESPLDDTGDVGDPSVIKAEEDLRDLEVQLEQYIERLRNSNDRLSKAAQSVVVQAGESSVEGLLMLLESEDPAVQVWALEAIRQIGPMAGDAEQAVRDLRDHPLAEVAQAATAALRQILD